MAGLKNTPLTPPGSFQPLLVQLLLDTAITRSFCSDPGATALGIVGCSASCGLSVLTGDQLSPQRAYELGLVNRLTDPGHALTEALALAERICVNAPVSVRQSLWALEQVNTLTDEAGWDASAAATAVVRSTEDFKEGRTAFFEKRSPNWQGR